MRAWRGLGELGQAGEAPLELGVVERGEGGFAGGGRKRRKPTTDAGRQADLLAPVVSREVDHLEAVEDGELDGLLGAGRQQARCLVELLDLVHGHEVGATELGEAATEGETRANPADQAGFGKRAADVGDRGLGECQAGGPARSGPAGSPPVSARNPQDERGAGDRRRERVGLAGVAASSDRAFRARVKRGHRHPHEARVPRPQNPEPRLSSRMDCVQHIDFRRLRVGILFSLSPVVHYAGRVGRRSRGGGPVSRLRYIASAVSLILRA